MKITCMRGYSGSGKSTQARQIAKETGAVVVCRDDLRMMLLGSYWTGKKEDEDRVTVAEEALISSLLREGVPVVADATHLHPPYLRKWAKLATRLGVGFEVVDVIEDVEECKKRVYDRWFNNRHYEHARYLDPNVVADQARRWPVHKWPTVTAVQPIGIEPYEYPDPNQFLPVAIIVDIDGTLAHMTGRSPYDYTRVLEDDLDQAVVRLIEDWKYANPKGEVLIVSGRDHTCREDTLAWLNKHSVPFDHLYMRNADEKDERGNKIPDWIVKYKLFNEHIRYDYNVHFVLDDRDQVVRMWRKLGLKCLQVAEGNF